MRSIARITRKMVDLMICKILNSIWLPRKSCFHGLFQSVRTNWYGSAYFVSCSRKRQVRAPVVSVSNSVAVSIMGNLQSECLQRVSVITVKDRGLALLLTAWQRGKRCRNMSAWHEIFLRSCYCKMTLLGWAACVILWIINFSKIQNTSICMKTNVLYAYLYRDTFVQN